jgi:hypothetical protein
MHDGTGTDRDMNDQDLTMDAADAAAIMAEASDRARRRFEPDQRATFIAWGVIWFVGDGITWLVVRQQHPFHGPSPVTFAVSSLIVAVVAMASVSSTRAGTGVRGRSVLLRWTFFLSLVAGLGAMFSLEAALTRAGASHSVVDIFEASGAILVIGLIYLARFAGGRDWVVAGLGLWMVVVAAAAGSAGPVAVWAVGALAVGLGFLAAAAAETWAWRA